MNSLDYTLALDSPDTSYQGANAMQHEWKSGDLLTTPEVAEILDVTPAWVSELCRQGRVPGAVQRGRFWFVPFEAIENIKDVKMGRPPKIGG